VTARRSARRSPTKSRASYGASKRSRLMSSADGDLIGTILGGHTGKRRAPSFAASKHLGVVNTRESRDDDDRDHLASIRPPASLPQPAMPDEAAGAG
jgi:hypothetical protein